MRWLPWLWALPYTLLGLLLGLLARAHLGRDGWILEFRGGALDRLLHPWADAIALGHVILARDTPSLDRLRAHERVHVRQYERLGPFFLPVYLALAAWTWLRGGHPYRDHPLEVEARAGKVRGSG
ncbi:MAG: signal peptide prediction [Burkholderiales bacterium]|nr:signal peptide prediction [Burkholderiales bacterium]